MDQEIRNKLRNVVTQCRKLLEDSISQELEGKYGIFAKKDQVTADPNAKMNHLSEEEQAARKDILDHFGHINARGFKPKESLDQLVREIAFTHLNRLCAYKMMEAREVYVGGQKFREAVSRGVNSNGVKFYLADHEEDERLFNTGHQDVAYRHYLDWLGGALSDEIGVLFNPNDPANRLYPRQKTLDEVLDLLNEGSIKAEEAELREQWPKIWSQDETIGWVYQYFTPKELRDQARKESQAPRNSYELAFRNQFFTPRYVVEFLTENTLGRIWYEMRKGDTKLKDQCRYMVRRPTEIFLKDGEQPPKDAAEGKDDLSQEELLKLPVHIPHRPKKDPRELKILDPACGSGHFLLYCFDLLLTIYEEAYADPDLGPALKKDYPTLDALKRDVPRLILAHNLHGIDIDLRASQIAALALWLRCQRAYQDMGLKKDRPKITRSNFVCAEPMPGDEQMLKEFVSQLEPKVLGQVVEVVFEKMKLAGEAGSLLKIEEEIRDAVAQAMKQWLAGPVSIQRSLFDDDLPVMQQQRFDLTGVTDAQFFEQAESKVVEALRNYAEKAQNGQRLQRRLFTEDAVRGFAFVDVCHKRFDVLLMNPPFGTTSAPSKSYIGTRFSDSKDDVDAAFVRRASELLVEDGVVGAIINRTQFYKPSLRRWREDILLGNCPLQCSCDLGFGVLDGALVEAAAYVLKRKANGLSHTPAVFFRLLKTEDKGPELLSMALRMHAGTPLPEMFLAFNKHFFDYPESRIAYWGTYEFRQAFRNLPSCQSAFGKAQVGMSTKDDFRFLRLLWEVPPTRITVSRHDCEHPLSDDTYWWVPLAKGGEYAPYYGDIHLAVDWTANGGRIADYVSKKYPYLNGNVGWVMHPESSYFESGISYTRRTTSGFSPRFLPAGCIFSEKGLSIFTSPSHAAGEVLAILMTRVAAAFIEVMVESGDAVTSGSAARSYEANLISSVPVPNLIPAARVELRDGAFRIWATKRSHDACNETSRYFVTPLGCYAGEAWQGSISTATENMQCWLEDGHLEVLKTSWAIERRVAEQYGLDENSTNLIEMEVGCHPWSITKNNHIDDERVRSSYVSSVEDVIDDEVEESGGSRTVTKKSYYADRQIELLSHVLELHPEQVVETRRRLKLLPQHRSAEIGKALLSYYIGCTMGRWDIRFATGAEIAKDSHGPLDPVPHEAPGTVRAEDSIPALTTLHDYSLSIALDGILIDSAEHQRDVVRCVRDTLEMLWKGKAETIEKEACEILGVKELREYFRKPGKGGFWDDHISRYSKSRRKAPIYWLLQSSKKNYAIWLYYHRLDKDLLFKALVNYVEPKIRLEISRLESLHTQKAAAGESGKEAKRLAKDVERQEDFLSELRDFEDKLRRAANLHLEPDLNDGVVLNIAPLWELVPWKEAKSYWDELLKGEYEWSSIGKQLRQKGLVK